MSEFLKTLNNLRTLQKILYYCRSENFMLYNNIIEYQILNFFIHFNYKIYLYTVLSRYYYKYQ